MDIARQLAGERARTPVLIALTKASHLHLMLWDDKEDPLLKELPEHATKELEILGLTTWSPRETILIPAIPEELSELGLNPENPITLKDVTEAIKRKLTAQEPILTPK